MMVTRNAQMKKGHNNKEKHPVAVIVGGSSGVGAAVAEAFYQKHYRVVVVSRDPFSKGLATKENVESNRVAFLACDISQPRQIATMVDDIMNRFGRIDVVYNAAGIVVAKDLTSMSEEDFDRLIAVKLKGSFFLMKAVLPIMAAQGRGVVINTVGNDHDYTPDLIGYTVVNGGNAALTKALAAQYAKFGVRVNAVLIGTAETPALATYLMEHAERNKLPKEQVLQNWVQQHPMGRLGTVYDVAPTVVWLASEEASFITGAIIPVDGGLTL